MGKYKLSEIFSVEYNRYSYNIDRTLRRHIEKQIKEDKQGYCSTCLHANERIKYDQHYIDDTRYCAIDSDMFPCLERCDKPCKDYERNNFEEQLEEINERMRKYEEAVK